MEEKSENLDVFINCPFDEEYAEFEKALVLTIRSCGFFARSAKEVGNEHGSRLNKIINIMQECNYSIHDLSRVELDENYGLPRFNMPFELGLWYGLKTAVIEDDPNINLGYKKVSMTEAHRPIERDKNLLVLERKSYRLNITLSDLLGFDYPVHNNQVNTLIKKVTNFLQTASKIEIPGENIHIMRFKKSKDFLKDYCNKENIDLKTIEFAIYSTFVTAFIKGENENDFNKAIKA